MFHPRALAPLAALVLLAGAAVVHAGPAVTVYTQDLGFVREPRTLTLASVRDTVRIENVSNRLDFSSVRLVPASGRVARLAYRWDVATGDALVERALGSRVRVSSQHDRVAEGTLIAADGSWLVVRADDGSISTLSRTAVEEVRIAHPPASLALKPAIEAVIEASKPGPLTAELSYLTGGLSWSAEHTVVRQGEKSAVWSSAVTVENTTGRDYVDATLKLVAGDPHRAAGPQPPPIAYMRAQVADAAMEKGADLSEQTFGEYHLYSLDRPATLRDRESQRLTMLDPHTVTVTPRYLYRGGDARGVMAQLEMKNTKENGLGEPLAGGRVRIYEADPSGALQFTGESTIKHTPEGEKVSLDIGAAFDLAAERREVSSKRISDREREYSVEIKLRNRKKTAVSIVVNENAGGDTEITQQSHPSTRKDANTLEWTIPVPAGQEAVLTYTARVRW